MNPLEMRVVDIQADQLEAQLDGLIPLIGLLAAMK